MYRWSCMYYVTNSQVTVSNEAYFTLSRKNFLFN